MSARAKGSCGNVLRHSDKSESLVELKRKEIIVELYEVYGKQSTTRKHCLFESTDYETAVRLAVSLGGDADTMTIIGRNRRLQCRKSPKNRSVTLGRHCDFLFHLFYLYSGSDS